MTLETLWIIQGVLTTFVGLALGSFANLAIHRIPKDMSVVSPASHCPQCQHPLRRRDNIPVISWLILRGACRDCDAPIHPRYLTTELLMGLLSALIYLRFVPTPMDLFPENLVAVLLYSIFATALVVATFVDIGHLIIPDSTSILAAPVGLASVWALSFIGFHDPLVPSVTSALYGAVGAGLFFALFSLLATFILKHDGLGWGDVKLTVMLGAWLGGWPGIIVVVMLASLFGSVIGIAHLVITRRRAYLPFGPSLAVAGIIYLLYGHAIVSSLLPTIALSLRL